METLALLESLSNTFGVAGFEDDVRDVLRPLVTPLADETRTDPLGNLIAVRRGRTARVLMLDAHMDEIGFIINHVEDTGFLRFATIGGWDARILPAQAVTIRARSGTLHRGVIGALPPHLLSADERTKPLPIEALFIDIGADSAVEVADRGIRIGDPGTLAYPFETLGDGSVLGKAFDDRVGCVVMLKTLEALAGRTPEMTVACNFAVAEEIGLRGARTAAYQLDPVIALALEGTVAADVPGVSGARQVTRLGRGPAISVADNSIIVRPQFVRALERMAEARGIPYQLKTPLFGGTDAGAIHLSRGGVLAGGISVPCRYIHTPLSLLRLGDVEGAIRLVTAFVEEAHTLVG
ncbi:MAG TPA: M42 family metallopeptidase [bacterium]|nr:M42 family metallopeptidase [bacterium]